MADKPVEEVPKVVDITGKERGWDWAEERYGIQLVNVPGSSYKLVEVREVYAGTERPITLDKAGEQAVPDPAQQSDTFFCTPREVTTLNGVFQRC